MFFFAMKETKKIYINSNINQYTIQKNRSNTYFVLGLIVKPKEKSERKLNRSNMTFDSVYVIE